MKSLKVLIATLILGSASLAFADPIVRDHRSDSRFDERRSDRFEQRLEARRFHRNQPVALASNMEINLRRGTFLSLDAMQRLRFDSDEGHAYIHSIVLTYSNGAQRTL